jgi:hypothetical protein
LVGGLCAGVACDGGGLGGGTVSHHVGAGVGGGLREHVVGQGR